jgi:hypothetical protein
MRSSTSQNESFRGKKSVDKNVILDNVRKIRLLSLKMPDLPSYGSLTKNSYGSLSKNGADNVVVEDGEVNNEDAANKSIIDDEHDSAFQEGNTYYLKNSAPLSVKKVLLSIVPILGAVLLMGGIVLFLLRDFNHLYPGRGGDQNPSPDDYHHSSSPPVVVVHSLGTSFLLVNIIVVVELNNNTT